MGEIDHDLLAVRVELRVGVAVPFARIFGRRQEVAQRNAAVACHLVKITVPQPILAGTGVIENPLVPRQLGAVAVQGHDVGSDDFGFLGLVPEEVELLVNGN